MTNLTRSDVKLSNDLTVSYSGRKDGFVYAYPSASFFREGHFYSVLEEEMTPNSGRPRGWKQFEHYKGVRIDPDQSASLPLTARLYEFEPHLYDAKVSDLRFGSYGYSPVGNQVRPFGEPGLPVEGLPGYRVGRSDGGFVPPPDGLGALLNRAESIILPGIKADLSTLNSVYELKDLTSVPRTISNISSFVTKFNLTQLRGTLRSAFHTGGDGYLQAKFNVLPLLSDIAGIQQAILRAKERADDLLRRAQMVNVRHWTTHLDEYPNLTDTSEGYLLWRQPDEMSSGFLQYSYGFLDRSVFNDPSRFHVEIEYTFRLSQYEVENAQLLALLDGLGINANPAIIWNAIPWSFVVDWVFGVSRFLSQHGTTLNLDPQVHIRRSLWSIKRGRLINVRRHVGNYYLGGNAMQQTAAGSSVKESAYRRQPYEGPSSSLATSGLSPTEISLGGALLVPRKWTPKRRNWGR